MVENHVFVSICAFTLILIVEINASTQYCKIDRNHIACRHTGKFSPKCKDAKLARITAELKKLILDTHNGYRNKVAGGQLPNFEPAREMIAMKYNQECEYLASLNVKQCEMKHDKSRNTKKFPYCGQNLYVKCRTGEHYDDAFIIEDGVKAWFEEYRDCSMTPIRSYQHVAKTIGHYTQVVADRAGDVGCAISQYTKGKMKCKLLCCNYSMTNMLRQPVYVPGKAASGCKAGVDERYRFLCRAN